MKALSKPLGGGSAFQSRYDLEYHDTSGCLKTKCRRLRADYVPNEPLPSVPADSKPRMVRLSLCVSAPPELHHETPHCHIL